MEPAAKLDWVDPMLGSLVGGRYRLLERLGEGGSGVVYDAEHEELGRPVALKVLGAAWAYDPAAVERFQREARAASSLGHRHIVDVYDLGSLKDGRPYLVMERLYGEPLDSHRRALPLPPQRVAEIVAEAASALEAVHRQGLVHRDIKPENLFLATVEGAPKPDLKLLDFGLATISAPDESHSRLTRHGTVNGTPHYLAPEAAGHELPDHRADIYSLGVVAYELLTGMVPFDDPNVLAVLALKQERDAPSLSAATGAAFPEALEEVFRRVLSRNPEMRYDTAGEFAAALRSAIEGDPAEHLGAADASGGIELPVRRAPLWIAAAAAATVAIVVIGLAAVQEGPSSLPGQAADETRGQAEDLRAGAGEAEHATPVSGEQQTAAGPVAALAETEHGHGEADAVREAVAASSADSDRRARVETTTTARTERARRAHQRAAALTRDGTRVLLEGRLSEAIGLFAEATEASPRHAPAWRGLGLSNERLGREDEAARAYGRYLTLAPDAPDSSEVRRRLESLR